MNTLRLQDKIAFLKTSRDSQRIVSGTEVFVIKGKEKKKNERAARDVYISIRCSRVYLGIKSERAVG